MARFLPCRKRTCPMCHASLFHRVDGAARYCCFCAAKSSKITQECHLNSISHLVRKLLTAHGTTVLPEGNRVVFGKSNPNLCAWQPAPHRVLAWHPQVHPS